MSYGPEMVVRSETFGNIRLGCAPAEVVAAAAPIIPDETKDLRDRFRSRLEKGWPQFVEGASAPPEGEGMFWVAWREDAPLDEDSLVGVVSVFRNGERTPPQDRTTYVLVRRPYWGNGVSGLIRAGRLVAAFNQGVLALHASIKDENPGSHKVVRKQGGVEVAHIIEDGCPRTDFITVNPERVDEYWRRAIDTGLATEEQRTSEAFQNGLSRTRIALDAARRAVTFLQHPPHELNVARRVSVV